MEVVFFRRLLVFVIVFNYLSVYAQNLVPNPSFEDTIVCAFSQRIDNSPPWVTPPGGLGGGGSPDHFHACWNPDEAATGVGCAGIIGTYYGINSSLREYIQIKLTQPLVAGECYDVSFKWILQGGPFPHTFGIDCIGMYISTNPLTRDYLSTIPQVRNPVGVPMINFNSWTQLTDTYTATGGEEWITLGNFQDLSVMTLYPIPGQPPPQNTHLAYYLLDDVSIVPPKTKGDTICAGEQAIIYKISCASSQNWYQSGFPNPSLGMNDTLYVSPTASTDYVVTSLPSGVSDTVTVVVDLGYTINREDTICKGDSILLAGMYQKFSGVYLDTLPTVSGCDSIITTTLAVQDVPRFELRSDTVICNGDSILLTVEGLDNVEYLWNTGQTASSIIVRSNGIYWLEVKDECGITFRDSVVLESTEIDFDKMDLFPNAITPNGDGMNDALRPNPDVVSEINIVSFQLNVFNRWGKKVAEVKDPGEGWKPKDDIEEVYFYTVHMVYNGCGGDQVLSVNGDVTLLR